jgi:hypothetical protein
VTLVSDTILRDLVLKRREAETQAEDEWSALALAEWLVGDALAAMAVSVGGPR